MRVIVSGGAGFIGSNFVDLALQQDWFEKIYVVDKLTYSGKRSNVSTDERVEFIESDLADVPFEVLSDVGTYYNFAAETHVDNAIESSLVFSESNIISVHKLLETLRSRELDLRFVQISTDEVYGQIFEGSFTEENALNPRNPYSATKASAEMLVKGYVETYGIDAIITRSSNNYGPKQLPEKLLPKMITNFIKGKPIGIYGKGKQVRDWTFVEDNCFGVKFAADRLSKGDVVNVSANNEYTNLEITNKVLTLMNLINKKDLLIKHIEDRLGHDFRYSIETVKIRKLGWKPNTNIDDGLKQTINWYKVHKL